MSRYEKDQLIAYAASRAPAVYGTTFRVMNEVCTINIVVVGWVFYASLFCE